MRREEAVQTQILAKEWTTPNFESIQILIHESCLNPKLFEEIKEDLEK